MSCISSMPSTLVGAGHPFLHAGIHESEILERRSPIDQWQNLETIALGGLHGSWLQRWKVGDDLMAYWAARIGAIAVICKGIPRYDVSKLGINFWWIVCADIIVRCFRCIRSGAGERGDFVKVRGSMCKKLNIRRVWTGRREN